jgi:hypothetical protein
MVMVTPTWVRARNKCPHNAAWMKFVDDSTQRDTTQAVLYNRGLVSKPW